MQQGNKPTKVEETAQNNESSSSSSFVSYKIYLANSDEKRRLGFKKVPNFEKFSEQLRLLFVNTTATATATASVQCCQPHQQQQQPLSPESAGNMSAIAIPSECFSKDPNVNVTVIPNMVLHPTATMKIKYVDEEGDMITVSTAQEWKEASLVLASSPIKRIYVSFDDQRNEDSSSFNDWKGERRAGGQGRCCRRNKEQRKAMKALMKKQLSLTREFPLSKKAKDKDNNEKDKELKKKFKREQNLKEIPIDSISTLLVGSLVHLRSRSSGKNLRILQGGENSGKVDFLGENGNWATFLVHRGVQNPNAIRFQSVANPNHWLRISKKGELNGLGKGGPLTEFVLIAPRLKKYNKLGAHEQDLVLFQKMVASSDDMMQQQQQPLSPSFVCLRAVTMGLHVGSLPSGSIKDPKKVGTGKCAQFLIIPKLNN